MKREELLTRFENPGAEWRGKPFWAWNGKLEKAELLRQVHVMKQMGFGGFFMHSRTGLVTEYLGDEWFDLINACADEAEKLGMEAWLYDEDRWPSGLAGGLVTQHPEYRALSLQMDRLPLTELSKARKAERLVAIFLADVDGLSVRNAKRLPAGTMPAKGETRTLLVFRVVENEPRSFYNGYTYVDTLNRKATDEFLRLTHEEYRKRCGSRLGRSIKGIFTDEPHRGRLMVGDNGEVTQRQVPWTASLPKRFRTDFGYHLINRLPEIFLRQDGQAISQVKWHFVECLQRMFLDNFAKPYAEWCRRNKLQVTGHILHEDSLAAQTAMSGSMMRYYEHMNVPGVDVLGRDNRSYWIVKQLSSAARQLGKSRLLSELYGCTGWDMPFSDHKAIGDWQALFGINLRCPHLSWYTMEGEAKRDYPASIIHHSTWWQSYDTVERYFARIGILLGEGRSVCEVLVLNSVESVWCQVHEGWAHWLDSGQEWHKDLMRSYSRVFWWLSDAQIDFDYGDEDMLARLASVRGGRGAPILRVGKAEYRVVVMPRLATLRGATLALLEKFRAAGGTVIFADGVPRHVDALPSQAAEDFAAKCRCLPRFARENLVAAVDLALGCVEVRVTAADGAPVEGIYAQMRRADGHDVVMLLNTDRQQGVQELTVRIRATGTVEEWDCLSGARRIVPARRRGAVLEFCESFTPGASHVYVIRKRRASGLSLREALQAVSRSECRGPFAYRLGEPNVCVLDRAQFRIDSGSWSPAMEILKADQAVRKKLGIELRGGDMLQPWWVNRTTGGKPDCKGNVVFRYPFEMAEMPETPVELVIERPSNWRIRFNEVEMNSANATGWWVDVAIQRLPIPPAALRRGVNIVEIETDFHYGTNPEALFILGSFGVTLNGTRRLIGRLPQRLRLGDVVRQGLPFYSGTIVYQLPMRGRAPSGEGRLVLCVPGLGGTCARVSVPGVAPATLPWHPYEADVTDMLATGAHTLELEVVTSRRNSFGPLHETPSRPDGIGSRSGDDYVLVPAGLLAAPVLEVRS